MYTEPIRINPVIPEDLPVLLELSRTTFYETFAADNTAANMQHYLDTQITATRIRTELENPDSIWYKASKEHTIIGYLKLNCGPAQTELQDNKALEIERIYVLQQYQGLHAGKALLQKAIDIAKTLTLDYIWLGVWERNIQAIGFYKRHGFIEFDTHGFLLGDELQTDILMKLDLG